jgi:tetratricopeptide (TPR) repeat protein
MRGVSYRIRILTIALGLAMLNVSLALPARAQISDGDIGGNCYADGTCSNGVCVGGADGFCAPCGMPGQAACPGSEPGQPSWCHLDGWGYDTVATTNGSICINPRSDDCGQVGTRACDRDGRPFCYYGVASTSRLGTVCIACGSIGEACCKGTDLICDTGSCQAGICRLDPPKPADPAKAIQQAIIACEFDKARRGLAALKSSDPNRDMLTRWLDDAEAIERKVDELVRQAEEALQSAKRNIADGAVFAAMGDHANAESRYEAARDMTRCPTIAEKLDELALSALLDAEHAIEAMVVDQYARAMGVCDFESARGYVVWAERDGHGSAAKMRQRYEEARAAERQALAAYKEGQAANARGTNLMAARDFAGAAAAYGAARTEFERAGQLTECAVMQDAIVAAIREIGANEVVASDLANSAGAAPSGTGSGGVANAGAVDPTPPGAHPCLDNSIPYDASLTSYSEFLGGGNTRVWLKGQYICGKVHQGTSFEIFDGSTITGYQCDQEGDRYVNCAVSGVYTIIDVYNVDNNAIDYHYKCGPNRCWIHVMPKSD